jgi:hypothetical protein
MSRQAAQLDHSALVGHIRESLFETTLGKNLLPARYGIGHGRIVGVDGKLSREADVVFYNALDCPRFSSIDNIAIFPSLGVHGIVEIKSTLDRAELEDGINKIAAFRELYSNEPFYSFGTRHVGRPLSEPKPFGVIFAYRAATSLESLLHNLMDFDAALEPHLRCDLIVVNDLGIIRRPLNGGTPMSGLPVLGQDVPAIAVHAGRKTLYLLYKLLSEMLISVRTFPVSPALYERVAKNVLGHVVSGQIREIDPETGRKESLSTRFLEAIVRWTDAERATTLAEAERVVFEDRGLDFTSLGNGPVWIYDPDNAFPDLEFEPRAILGSDRIRSLASACFVIAVGDRFVLVPMFYASGENIDIEER